MPYQRAAGTFVAPHSAEAKQRNGGRTLTPDAITAARVDPKFTDHSLILPWPTERASLMRELLAKDREQSLAVRAEYYARAKLLHSEVH
jgi:hypothetical protein